MTTNPQQQQQEPLKYIDSDFDTLYKIFEPYKDIPSFITWSPQWSEEKQKWLKRPTQAINNPALHMTLPEAQKRGRSVGLVCDNRHNIIAIDIDGAETASGPVHALLEKHPTYSERSPSGKENHIRLLYYSDEKSKLKRKGTAVLESGAVELYNLSTNFVTLTGQGEPIAIATITADELTAVFPVFKPTKVISLATGQPTNAAVTSPAVWLSEVPCDRHDPSLVAFLGKHQMIYHDYWLLGIMSIHAAFGSIQGFATADAWSKKSGDDYDDEEVLARWTSFSDPNFEHNLSMPITAGTYQWLFNEFTIQWPIYKGKTKIPKPDEFENFLTFMRYKGLTPEIDALTCTPFMDGEDYAIYPTFYKSKEHAYSIDIGDLDRLAVTLVMLAQDYKFRPTTNAVRNWLMDMMQFKTKRINRFAREIALRPLYNPDKEPDYLQIMGRDIIQRNPRMEAPTQEFHELLVRKWLISLGRNLWSESVSTSEGVLILSSPKGGINKSSFGQRLFPKEWQHLHVTTKPRLSGQFIDKDSILKTIGKIVVDFDEAERIFSHNDTADLKAYLTEQFDVIRPPYGRDHQKHKRSFACLASTNLQDLVFPREGARRYWWLNVDYVDTYAMDDMDMYNMWRQIYYIHLNHSGKRAPYILTTNEIRYLESYLVDHTTTNSIESVLYETFDFSDEGFDKYKDPGGSILNASMSISEVKDKILPLYQGTINHKMLVHALTALLRRHAPFTMYVGRNEITQGMCTLRRQTRYFMPELRNDALARAAEEKLL